MVRKRDRRIRRWEVEIREAAEKENEEKGEVKRER
jgi:hypothetical protein